jgi:hypothetical protein
MYDNLYAQASRLRFPKDIEKQFRADYGGIPVKGKGQMEVWHLLAEKEKV